MTNPEVHWTLDPIPLAAIGVYALAYLTRFTRARREAGGRGAGARQLVAFGASVLVLLAALVSPLDGLAEDYLFSAHMAQHLLIGDLAPLLALLSLSRVILRPATRRLQAVERALGPLAHPATGLVLWTALIYLWHLPSLYVAALEHPALHALQHACFFAAGTAIWWPLVQPIPMRRRLRGMGAFAYVLSAKLALAALGLYLTWSTILAYGYYAHVPRVWGLSALEDQNVGGALMMVEQSLLLVTVFVVLFVRMLGESEAEERRREALEDAAAAT